MPGKYQEIKVFYINIFKRIKVDFLQQKPFSPFYNSLSYNADHSYFYLGKSSKAYNS